MATYDIKVKGMTCGHCADAVTNALTALDGVQEVSFGDVNNGGITSVDVTGDANLDEGDIRAAINDAGYELYSVAVN
ncbi:MAG: heavy-metal-associated domain-containing protein [Cellulomonadaceae bacterium]|jgi:copper chaperone CopZ|nr:heavy-metal-associated domain-containing protein [Cellulomonadaceae bacterium]